MRNAATCLPCSSSARRMSSISPYRIVLIASPSRYVGPTPSRYGPNPFRLSGSALMLHHFASSACDRQPGRVSLSPDDGDRTPVEVACCTENDRMTVWYPFLFLCPLPRKLDASFDRFRSCVHR